MSELRKEPDHWKRLEVKFEDLKIVPNATLLGICDELGISWDDRLLKTTHRGVETGYPSGDERIVGFDLKPVFNLYEEYFSEMDRFRISMLFSREQKKYGYFYTRCNYFSRRQLQEIFIREFRFENRLSFESDYWRNRYRADLIRKVNACIQKARREEILE